MSYCVYLLLTVTQQTFAMASLKIILLFACLSVLLSCAPNVEIRESPDTLPKNLSEAVVYFQKNWTKVELEDYKKKSEEDATTDQHFNTGMWIRNNWVRGGRDTALTNYFHSLGINHPDDISSIILTSLHRTLNNRDIALHKQVESYKKYWQPIIDCDKKQRVEALSNYDKFKVGDNVTVRMPVDVADGSPNAVSYECPKIEWAFDKKKDLIIKGKVTKKYFINDTTNVFFSIEINFMNNKDIEIFMNKVNIGDTKDFSLKGLSIE